MNILAITQIYPQPDDNKEKDRPTSTVEYFAKQWVEMGHNVTVVHCPSKFPRLYYKMPKKLLDSISNKRATTPSTIESRSILDRIEFNIRIHRIPMTKFFPGQAFSVHMMRKQTHRIIKTLEVDGFVPDLVVGHFANPSLELVVNIAEFFDIPSSIVFHTDCTKKNIKKYRIKKLIKRVGAIGSRSITEARRIQRELELLEIPFICYSGVPNTAISESKANIHLKHDYSLGSKHLFAGSLISLKNVDALIKAFCQCYRGSLSSLEIIGGGVKENELKALVRNLRLEKQVKFSGRLSRAEVINRMRDAHIFSMISSPEAFGMVYLEAMLQGCIVIGSKGEGIEGVIVDGKNGFLCRPGDDGELCSVFQRIEKLTKEERSSIAENAVLTAKNMSERSVAEKYLNDVIERNKRKKHAI